MEANLLSKGSQYGFVIPHSDISVVVFTGNLKSVHDFPDVNLEKLGKEVQLNWMVFPFQEPPSINYVFLL